MKDNLIVTQQDPVSMAFDVFLTIIAWVGFLYLIGSGIYDNITDKNLSFIKGTWSETTVTLCLYFSLMVIFAILLYGWAKYNYFRYRGKPHHENLTSPVMSYGGLLICRMISVPNSSGKSNCCSP